MQFIPDSKKQVEEVYFLKKISNLSSHSETFSNTHVATCSSQKHLGLLDQQLNFNDRIQSLNVNVYV